MGTNTKPMRGVPVDDSWRIEAQLHGEFSGFGPRNDERDDLDGLWSSKHYPSTNLLAGKRLGSEKYTSHLVWSQLFTSNLSQQREKVRNRLIDAWRRGVLTCDGRLCWITCLPESNSSNSSALWLPVGSTQAIERFGRNYYLFFPQHKIPVNDVINHGVPIHFIHVIFAKKKRIRL